MALEVSSQSVGEVTLVRCVGRIAVGEEAEALQRELKEFQKTSKFFVLNLREVNFLDSSGMGILVRFAGTLRAAHGGMKLCNVSEPLLKVLKLTKLDNVLEIYEHELEAVNAFYHQKKQAAVSAEGAQVICIDSSENVLAYLRALLTQHGFSVMSTASAYDARILLKATRPALVILGPHVPGVKNQHFVDAIKDLPVLALGAEFHTGEAGAAAEMLMIRIKTAMNQDSSSAGQ